MRYCQLKFHRFSKGKAMGSAFAGKGFFPVFYEIGEELQVDVKISEKGTVDADYALIEVPADKTVTVFDV